MAFFKEVEGEAAILVRGGVYKQVPLYTRDGFLFAKVNGGFVRLYADGSTTQSKLRLDFMSWEGVLCRDRLGRLCAPSTPGAIRIQGEHAQRLLGSSTE